MAADRSPPDRRQQFIRACRDHDARFSVTVKQLKPIKKAIAAIPDEYWVPVDYWLQGGVSADVAETTYTAFKNTRDEITLRLIVRRVRPTPGSQLALDVVFDYHPILTDRDGEMLEVEADHRAHAVVELAIRELKAGGLAHVPSGKFNANPAWLALAILAHNLARWSLKAAGASWEQATTETLRTKLVSMPARLVHAGRRMKLRVPTNWPCREPFENALARIAAIPT